jgi:hypothetical protein
MVDQQVADLNSCAAAASGNKVAAADNSQNRRRRVIIPMPIVMILSSRRPLSVFLEPLGEQEVTLRESVRRVFSTESAECRHLGAHLEPPGKTPALGFAKRSNRDS